jgi:hypothetical protein
MTTSTSLTPENETEIENLRWAIIDNLDHLAGDELVEILRGIYRGRNEKLGVVIDPQQVSEH